MRSLLITLLLACSLRAAAPVVRSTGSTQTQINVVVCYSPATSPLTISVSDNNGGRAVPLDVDPTVFANSNTDLGRTSANGFRWPTQVSGNCRTIFIGGHDEVKRGLDGKWYSTALQCNTDHTITLANGGDAVTVHVATQNIPIGSYYPELMIPQITFRGEGAWPTPTIDYSYAGANTPYIDPMTGALLKLASHGPDNVSDNPGAPFNAPLFVSSAPTALLDPNSAWTSPANIDGGNPPNPATLPSVFATTSTANAPILIPLVKASGGNTNVQDFLLRLFGSGVAGTEIVSACFTIDGHTCATSTFDFTFSTTSECKTHDANGASACSGFPNTAQGAPGNFPNPFMSGWGGCINTQCGPWEVINSISGTIPNVSVSGSTLTTAGSRPGFNPARGAGTPYWLSGCTSGGPTQLVHSASVDNYQQLTLQESGLTLSGCTSTEVGSGFLVWLKNSGTVHVAARVYRSNPAGGQTNSDAALWICAPAKTTATTNCDGQAQAIGTTLCRFNNFGVNSMAIYSVQDDGHVCLQSNGFGTSNIVKDPKFASATSLYVIDFNGSVVYRMDHKGTDYSRYDPGVQHTLNDPSDKFIYSTVANQSPAAVVSAVQASNFADVKKAINSGLFTGPGLNNICDYAGGYALEWGWGARSPSGTGFLTMKAWTDVATGNLLGAAAFWGLPNGLASSAAHSPPFCVEGYSELGVVNLGQPSPMYYNAGANLGGPFISQIAGIRDGSGGFHGYTIPGLTTISSATPAVAAYSSSPDLQTIQDQQPNGNIEVTCSGGTGSWAALNTTTYWYKVDGTHYAIYADARGSTPVNSTTWPSFTGQSLTCTTSPAIYHLQVSSVANNGGSARLTMAVLTTSSDKFKSGRYPIRSQDPIVPLSFNQNLQLYMKAGCSGCAANQFDLYTDGALTQPYAYTSGFASAMVNGWIAYAETCPDPATLDTSWFFEDPGLGTTGNVKVRCVTLRLKSEPISEWSSGHAESTFYPASVNPNDLRSQLHAINIADGFFDTRDIVGGEYTGVLKKVVNAPNSIDVTLVRWYGYQAGPDHASLPPCALNTAGQGCNPTVYNRDAGQSALQGALYTQYGINITNTTAAPIQFTTGIGHIHMGHGPDAGNVSVGHEYTPLSADSIYNTPAVAAMTSLPTTVHNDQPVWAGDNSRVVSGLEQNYTHMGQQRGVTDPIDFTWAMNWAGMLPGAGCNPNCQEGVFFRGTMTLQAGKSHVWKITPFGTVDQTTVKKYPLMVVNGVHAYLQDKSGPSSSLGDADTNRFCVAYLANECVTGSTIGSVYVNMTGMLDDGFCIASNSTRPAPCAVVVPPYGGWAIQMRIKPLTTTKDASGIRRVTLGWHAPMEHGDFQSWSMTPDARWGLFDIEPIHGHSANGQADSQSWWAIKIPPWPSTDDVPRITYPPINVTLPGKSGDQIRIRFGYGENGGATFDAAGVMLTPPFCTTRLEDCWTSSTATTAAPFVYGTVDTQHKTSCDTGCTIPVPAIPGRAMYYQVERSNGSSVVLGPVQSVLLN